MPSERELDRWWTEKRAKVADSVLRLNEVLLDQGELAVKIRDIKIRPPRSRGDDFMLIVRGYDQGLPVITFMTGGELDDVLREFGGKVARGDLRWKEDKPQE